MDLYSFADGKEVKNIFASADWSLKKDNRETDPDYALALSCYSEVQTFGYTDYVDHRKDTLEKIKKLILSMNNPFTQKKQLYNKDGTPKKKIVCWGSYGGVHAQFVD